MEKTTMKLVSESLTEIISIVPSKSEYKQIKYVYFI